MKWVFYIIMGAALILILYGIYAIFTSRKETDPLKKQEQRDKGNNCITIGIAILTVSSVVASLLRIKMVPNGSVL